MKVAVIIPTYNEVGAIGTLIDTLQSVFAEHPEHLWKIVVVDANSPDGTAKIVEEKNTEYGNLHLILEPKKQGIAMAYVTGMRYAKDTLKADAFVEFDGDGQHNPHDVARLIETLDQGYDHVIGSRYVPGGSIPPEWATYRKLLSRFGSLYARVLLELPVYDATSGLKATRIQGAGEYLPLSKESLLSTQYAYKLHFLHTLTQAHARIQEIPITFLMREHDISKSAWYDILESLRVTLLLRLQTLKQWRFLRVIAVGGFGFLVQASLFEIVGIRLHLLPPSTVVLLAGEAAVFTNFFLHQIFSFPDRQKHKASLLNRFTRFQILSASSVIIQWILVHATEVIVGDRALYLEIAYVAGVGLGLVVIYLGSYFWVWSTPEHHRLTRPVDEAPKR